ncbi:hypothetical protein [Pseudomonas laurylsulfatiphila]|uniref:hypothetical protein n=1 Tax=Pseudomonas laurylsulfatiphila TaxID=2011015 RepID=UPI003D1EFF3A
MVVNDNACDLDKRGAFGSIASKLAPTVSPWARSRVGAGLPAMVVNDNACDLDKRGVLESIASSFPGMREEPFCPWPNVVRSSPWFGEGEGSAVGRESAARRQGIK